MKRRCLRAGFWVLVVMSSIAAMGQPPRFNFQARLTDSGGVPLSGAHALLFRLYRGGDAGTADSGSLLFEETVNTSLANGIVNHAVGTGSGQTQGPLTAAMLRTTSDLFLQVSVEGVPVIPRTRLESVPYSLVSADGDPREAISGSVPIVLSAPGSYFLSGNITGTSGQDGIEITTSGVSLDLSGFSLVGVAGSLSGINLVAGIEQIEISNGTISGWGQNGVGAGINGTSARVHNIRASNNGAFGIVLGDRSLVEDCIAEKNNALGNAGGIKTGQFSIVHQCDCTSNTAIGSGLAVGIQVGNGSTVSNCVCNFNDAAASSANGINASAFCCVTGNVCTSNNALSNGGTGAGIRAAGYSSVMGNVCTSNAGGGGSNIGGIGIYLTGFYNEVCKNQCSGNKCISSAADGFGLGISGGGQSYIHDNNCSSNTGKGTGYAAGILCRNQSRIENNHCAGNSGSTSQNYGIWLSDSSSIGNTIIKNTTTGNTNAGLRFQNTSGSNYFAENVFNETTTVSQVAGGVNVAGTGDRSNVAF